MIVGHATFCIVVVYNNVVARLRRLSGSFEEASADLGADTWQTFRFVTFPSMKSALDRRRPARLRPLLRRDHRHHFTIGAGEETLPIWIFSNLFRPNELPIVNAVAVIVILISIIPVYLAHRLGGDEGGATAGRGGGAVGGRGHRSAVRRCRLVAHSAAVKVGYGSARRGGRRRCIGSRMWPATIRRQSRRDTRAECGSAREGVRAPAPPTPDLQRNVAVLALRLRRPAWSAASAAP